MTKTLISLIQAFLLIVSLACFNSSCSDNEGGEEPGGGGTGSSTEIKLTLPASVDVVKGQPCTLPQENGTILSTDVIYLELDGKLIACAITEVTSTSFSFKLPDSFQSDTYKLYVKRGDRRVLIGSIKINIVSAQIEINSDTTVYGVVESAEGPIKGVVVSDGILCTTTDENGIYQLPSKKEMGYVFISVPSGYECPTNGVFPEHYKVVNSNNTLPENASFTLKKVDQSSYKIIFLGDMHVANRSVNNDLAQFKAVSSELNNYVKTLPGRVYGISLGDMSWDLYWYDRKYDLSNYAKTINEQITSMAIYHTAGNHDNDMNGAGLSGAKSLFRTAIAPSYYSFNIGDVHYIVLDNINTSKYVANGGEANRTDDVMECGVLYDPQIDWIAKDLQYVDKSTPIMVMFHVPVFDWGQNASGFSKTMADADKLLAAFNGYNTVHYVSGHTHRSYNLVPEDAAAGGRNIYEHNLSAICADWWWSGNLTPGFLQSTDGTPAGYGVWDISGKDIKWIYKCAGKDENFQFRAYDLNEVAITAADVPNFSTSSNSVRNLFNAIFGAYDGSKKNEILINTWQMNSRWKVSMKTVDGKELDVKRVSAYDPVQIVANSLKRWNGATSSSPMGTAQNRHHFFKATAPDADTDVIITVTDEFGHTWTETMERPRKFSSGSGQNIRIDDYYRISL